MYLDISIKRKFKDSPGTGVSDSCTTKSPLGLSAINLRRASLGLERGEGAVPRNALKLCLRALPKGSNVVPFWVVC